MRPAPGHWRLLALVLALTLGLALAGETWADGRKHRNKKDHAARWTPNQTYAQACGQCHMVYPPCLLPAASWGRLLEGRADHFGQSLPLTDAEAGEIKAYLEANAADRSGGKRGRKIMASLGGATPLRPSEVPYLRHKHHDIAEAVFARPAVGGRGNCKACHPGAEQGDYGEHRANIPR
ncbi:MAG: diheme cytochrome c [Desulfarculus sp.]|nr:diheme cytochrome c [Desulfarculus sp.]